MGYGGGIYPMENGKCYKSAFFHTSPGEPVFKHLPKHITIED